MRLSGRRVTSGMRRTTDQLPLACPGDRVGFGTVVDAGGEGDRRGESARRPGPEIPTAVAIASGSTLGAPAAALGVIEGIADGVAGAARFGGGVLSDDPERRRRVAVGGYTVTAVLSSLIGLAYRGVAGCRAPVGAWLARGIRVPARNALLADVTAPGNYGRARTGSSG